MSAPASLSGWLLYSVLAALARLRGLLQAEQLLPMSHGNQRSLALTVISSLVPQYSNSSSSYAFFSRSWYVRAWLTEPSRLDEMVGPMGAGGRTGGSPLPSGMTKLAMVSSSSQW